MVTKICHYLFEICLGYSNCETAESAVVLALHEVQMINEPQSILVNSSNGDYVECFCLCRMSAVLGHTCELQSATSDL